MRQVYPRWFIRRSWTSAKLPTAIRPSHHSLKVDESSSMASIPVCPRSSISRSARRLRDVVIKGEPMEKIVDVLRHDELYPHPETLVTFFGNHDNKRFLSEKGSSAAKLKAAFSLLLTLRGIPQIYYGDEIAMPGGADPDNRRDFPGRLPRRSAATPSPPAAVPPNNRMFSPTCSRCWRCGKATPRCVPESSGTSDGTTPTTLSCANLPEEKLLIVYNNASKSATLDIPVENTPLETAHQLQTVFGNSSAELAGGKVRRLAAGPDALLCSACVSRGQWQSFAGARDQWSGVSSQLSRIRLRPLRIRPNNRRGRWVVAIATLTVIRSID